jgi:hypothetical protein
MELVDVYVNSSEEEREELVNDLSSSELRSLEKELWDREGTRDVALHLGRALISFRREEGSINREKVAGIAGGAVGSGGMAALAGADPSGIAISLICGGLLADVILTGLEEGGATARVGREIRNGANSVKEGVLSLFSRERK